MFNKIKEIWNNIKARILLVLVILLTKVESRKFTLKWLELKTGIISEEEFNEWMTEDIYNE